MYDFFKLNVFVQAPHTITRAGERVTSAWKESVANRTNSTTHAPRSLLGAPECFHRRARSDAWISYELDRSRVDARQSVSVVIANLLLHNVCTASGHVELHSYVRAHVFEGLLALEIGEHVAVALHEPLCAHKPVLFVLLTPTLDAPAQRLQLRLLLLAQLQLLGSYERLMLVVELHPLPLFELIRLALELVRLIVVALFRLRFNGSLEVQKLAREPTRRSMRGEERSRVERDTSANAAQGTHLYEWGSRLYSFCWKAENSSWCRRIAPSSISRACRSNSVMF